MMQFAGTLVIKEGQVLLVQESHTSAYREWSLPLGSVETNETLAEGAIRETKEETGYGVVVSKEHTLLMTGEELKSARRFHKEKVQLTIFEADVVSGELSPGEDILNAKWHLIEDLDQLKLRGNWVKDLATKTTR